jgi:hypothetical protein
VGPERHLGRHVNEPKMSGLASERLSFMCIVHLYLEQGIVVSGGIVDGPGGKFLVGRHERRSDIVRQQVGLRVDMQKLDDIVVTDDTASSAFGDLPGRNDLPVVVGIVVRVTSDLLTCIFGERARHQFIVLWRDAEGVWRKLTLRTDPSVIILQRISVQVRVQESLGILVLEGNRIVISQFYHRKQPLSRPIYQPQAWL